MSQRTGSYKVRSKRCTIGYDLTMRSWFGLVVVVSVISVTCACAVDNPTWLMQTTGSTSAGSSSSTSSETDTGTSSTTDATSTGLEPLACPGDAYCPYLLDLADPQGVCDFVDTYVAFREGTKFLRCNDDNGSCDIGNCSTLAIDLPEDYGPILSPIKDGSCITVVHETKTFDSTCQTRSLALWKEGEDPATAAPLIALAAHTPEAPPVLSDLSVSVETQRSQCDCGDTCVISFALDRDLWCCDNQLSLGTFAIDTGETTVRVIYEEYLGNISITYRGTNFTFVITQGHDACNGSGLQAGWFMTRG